MNSSLLFILALLDITTGSRVLELSDRFLDIRKDGHWLVMFYAPWCGHCKRLEPIWSQVAQALYNTPIRVGKVDCTRYTSVASTFKVSGFPTIMFLKGDVKEVVFDGERRKDELISFALRLSGPPVQQITRPETIQSLSTSENLYFSYVGPYQGPLWELYYEVAERFQPHSFFYSLSPELARKHVGDDKKPTVFVYKENSRYFFDGGESEDVSKLNASLTHWVNTERFGSFMKITRGNIHQFMQTNKYLVLAVVEENKLEEVPEDMIVFRDMIKSVIINHRDKFHRHFQFGWTGSRDLGKSLSLSDTQPPYLLVLNTTTQHHHIPQEPLSEPLTVVHVHNFLEAVLNQSAPTYGGNSLPVRLYRSYWEATTSLGEMWRGNPVLTSVILGLPLGFLSLLCYSICCQDILDADEEDLIDNEYSHEKKE